MDDTGKKINPNLPDEDDLNKILRYVDRRFKHQRISHLSLTLGLGAFFMEKEKRGI